MQCTNCGRSVTSYNILSEAKQIQSLQNDDSFEAMPFCRVCWKAAFKVIQGAEQLWQGLDSLRQEIRRGSRAINMLEEYVRRVVEQAKIGQIVEVIPGTADHPIIKLGTGSIPNDTDAMPAWEGDTDLRG